MPKAPPRPPVRTCVACRLEAGKADLIRVVRRPDGAVVRDASGRIAGRGAYVHADPACLAMARKRRAVERALAATVTAEVWAEIDAEGSRESRA